MKGFDGESLRPTNLSEKAFHVYEIHLKACIEAKSAESYSVKAEAGLWHTIGHGWGSVNIALR